MIKKNFRTFPITSSRQCSKIIRWLIANKEMCVKKKRHRLLLLDESRVLGKKEALFLIPSIIRAACLRNFSTSLYYCLTLASSGIIIINIHLINCHYHSPFVGLLV